MIPTTPFSWLQKHFLNSQFHLCVGKKQYSQAKLLPYKQPPKGGKLQSRTYLNHTSIRRKQQPANRQVIKQFAGFPLHTPHRWYVTACMFALQKETPLIPYRISGNFGVSFSRWYKIEDQTFSSYGRPRGFVSIGKFCLELAFR